MGNEAMTTINPEDAAARAEGEPVAYLHTLHMERGQSYVRLQVSPENAFGEPGRDYSEEYAVTVEPLYLAPRSAPDAGWREAPSVEVEEIVAALRSLRGDYRLACTVQAADALEALSSEKAALEARALAAETSARVAREALAFYADEARWQMTSAGITPAQDDRGHRARAALEGIKEPTDERGI